MYICLGVTVAECYAEDVQKMLDSCIGKLVVIDLYECPELLYDGYSLEDAEKAIRERIEDTDGECFCKILRRN